MSDPYNSHPSSSPAPASPGPPPLPLRATVVQPKGGLAINWVAPLNWLAAVVLIAIAISKHSSVGSALFVLTPIAFALLARSVIQSPVFGVVARVINGAFALLSLLKFLSLRPSASPTLALTFFVVMVVVPTFTAFFLSPKEDD